MSLDINDLSSKLFEYLLQNLDLSQQEMLSIKEAISIIREMSPGDIPLILRKMEKITSVSEDISWLIVVVNRKLISVNKEIRKIKDPKYTYIARQGRVSTAAIEAEVRMTNSEIYDLEDKYDSLKNILEYLKHLYSSMNQVIWTLKDKLSSGM